MDLFVFLALLQDGITTGAIYLLLAVGLLIVFSVTRVIFVPQGDLLAYGALTAASLQSGQVPGTLWLLDGASAVALGLSLLGGRREALRGVLVWGLYPIAITAAVVILAPRQIPAVSILLALAIVTPIRWCHDGQGKKVDRIGAAHHRDGNRVEAAPGRRAVLPPAAEQRQAEAPLPKHHQAARACRAPDPTAVTPAAEQRHRPADQPAETDGARIRRGCRPRAAGRSRTSRNAVFKAGETTDPCR